MALRAIEKTFGTEENFFQRTDCGEMEIFNELSLCFISP